MRSLFFTILLCISVGLSAQVNKEERKLTFLLHTEVDSLYIDCQLQDCDALLYNAPLFTKLTSLYVKNYKGTVSFRYFSDFKKVKNVYLENPRAFDLPKEVLKMNKPLRWKGLYLYSDSLQVLYKPGLSYYNKRKFFKKFQSLQTLHLDGVDLGLSQDMKILKNCKSLQDLMVVNVGVSMHQMKDLRYKPLRKLVLDEHKDPVEYQYTRRKLLRDEYVVRNYFSFREITFKPVAGLESSKTFMPYQGGDAIGKPKTDFSRRFVNNREYITWFSYYYNLTKREVATKTEEQDTQLFQYFGTLETGEEQHKFYSFAYKQYYDYYNKYEFTLWDTTSYAQRQLSTKYSNGVLLPIQWKKRNQSTYLKRRNKNLLKNKYFHRYQLVSLGEKNLFALGPIRTGGESIKKDLNYEMLNDFGELHALNRYAFSFVHAKASTLRKVKRDYILDAWFSYNDSTYKYYLHAKTQDRVYSIEINWWERDGSFPKKDVKEAFNKYKYYQARKWEKYQRKANRYREKIQKSAKWDPSFAAFKEKHISAGEEWGMSEQQWLQYKDWALENEEELLLSAHLNEVNFDYFLQIANFKELSLFTWSKQFQDLELIYSNFVTTEYQNFTPSTMYLLDKEKMSFTRFNLKNTTPSAGQNTDLLFSAFYLPIGEIANQVMILENNGKYFMARKLTVNNLNNIEVEEIPAHWMDYKTILKRINNL